MKDEVCKFGKFGFCKYKEGCHRKHYTEVCESLSECRNIKECPKRHPKICRRYFSSGYECQFKEDCAYTHSKIDNDEEKNKLKEKVEILEKTVIELSNKVEGKELERIEKVLHALTRKVLYLENEMKNIRNKQETAKDVLNENCNTKESSFNYSDIKHSSSIPKVLKDKETPSEKIEERRRSNLRRSQRYQLIWKRKRRKS